MSQFLENEEFIFAHKTSPTDFIRKRTWGFKNTFLFICSMLNKRVQSEIDFFFSEINQVPKEIRQATSSSFTQSRAKINFRAFKDGFQQLVGYYYKNYHFKRYYGYRLIAIDGSVFTLPNTKEMVEEFGKNVLSNTGKWIKAQVSFAVDVLNNICIGAEIGAYKAAEKDQASLLFKEMGENNLYLFDRGYFGRQFLKELAATGCGFCFRLQRNACREVIAFIQSNKTDSIEYIEVDGEAIKVRLTKVVLNTGEEEYLMTSLFDSKTFTINKLKALYHLRWGVEEQYKDMKYALCIENFIGKKPNSVKQEFYGNILSYNLSMMLCKPAVDRESNKKKKRLKYKTNKRALLAKIKQCFVKLFYDVIQAEYTIERIIKSISKESVPIRKGRKFVRGKAKIKTHRAYMSVV